MTDLNRYLQLKENLERRRREFDRAQGELDSLLSRLRKEFGCESLVEARRLLTQLNKGAEQLGVECDNKLAAFEAKFGSLLGGGS